MNTKHPAGVLCALSVLLLAAGQVTASDDNARDTAQTADVEVAAAPETAPGATATGTRWVQVTGSRIHREMPALDTHTRHLISHMPVYILTRDELDDTAVPDVGSAIRAGDPSSR